MFVPAVPGVLTPPTSVESNLQYIYGAEFSISLYCNADYELQPCYNVILSDTPCSIP